MKKLLLTICILLFLTISGVSQNIVDSLITVLEEEKLEDKERLELLLELCEEVNVNYHHDISRTRIYAEEATKLAEKENDHNLLGNAYLQLGTMYLAINFDTAILHLNNSLEIFNELENEPKIAEASSMVAEAYAYKGNSDTSLAIFKKVGMYYQRVSNNKKLCETLRSIGIAYYFLGNYSEALGYARKALTIAKQEKDIRAQSHNLSMIAIIHFEIASYDQALQYFYQALKISEELNELDHVAEIYTNIGTCYGLLGDENNAIEYYKKAMAIDRKLNNKRGLSELLVCIGESYLNLGEFMKVEAYANESLEISRAIGYKRGTVSGLTLLGEAAYLLEHYDKALEYYLEVQSLLIDMNTEAKHSGILSNIGLVYLEKDNYNKALMYFRKSNNLASANGELEYVCLSDSCLSLTFELLGNTDSALFYRKLYSWHQDSLINTEKTTKIANLQIQYETEKKEQQIALLEKDNQVQELQIQQSRIFNWGLVGLVVIILLMALLFIRQNKLKNEHKTVLLEQKLLRLQMNPHFIFNALSNILNFIDMKENEKASGYLATFSKLLRTTLESTRQDLVPFEKEVSSLKNYLELQKLRHNDKFDYHIEIDENIDGEDMTIPPMLVQPFIENAIEHGIRHKKTLGRIDLRFFLKDKKILCEVEDDGVGRAKAWEAEVGERSGHKSLATEIIKDRIKTLNKKFRQKIQLEIIDKLSENAEAMGTKVLIDLPYRSAFE